jgi:hypothetical protein
MKKIYSLLCFVAMSFLAVSQSPILTMISDGDCSGGTPKVVEIYAQGTVDFSLYSLEIQTNSNTTWGSTENLGGLGTVTDAFVYVYGSAAAAIFATEYPSAVNTYGAGGSVNFNGDDRIRIIEDVSGSVIDQYGEDGIDGTGTFWEYKDGFGKRVNSTGPDGAFVQANWEYNNGVLNNQGSCQGGDTFESISTAGSFVSPGGGTEPVVSTSPVELTSFVQFVGTPSDEQTIEVIGSNLTTDVTATVNGDYEISLTTATGFGPSVVLLQTAGEVTATLLYVRLNGSAPASPSNGEITFDFDGGATIVTLSGEILNPDPVLFAQPDSLNGFSHFVGTPSAEEVFNVSGNYLTEDMTIDVTGEYEIALASNGTFTNSLAISANANATAFDVNAGWSGYMNVFELPENGGGYVFGTSWGLADLRALVAPASNSVELLPNINTYADNTVDPFWVDQTTGAGNKNMEAITLVEPGVSANDNDLTFVGNVVNNTLDAGYTAKYFIKALDPNNGFADVFNGSKTLELPISGTFSVSATAAELPAGLIVQYGFVMVGPNADPATAGDLGSVTINGDFPVGEVESTPIYVRLNGTAQNYNQTGLITVAAGQAIPKTVALFGESLDYSQYTIGEVTTNTANGVADSLDVLVSLVGVVHCIDFDGNEGISFTIIDANNDGINVFNFDDVSDYVVNEGDKITVLGKIGQFNGLTQVFADSILVLESGLATATPTIVTALDESTEAQWITIENVNFVDPIATFPSGSNNIDVTDGTNIFTLRIDSDTDIPGGAAPQVDFSVTGLGGQYDNSDPYDSGYQLFPCGLGSFTPNDVSGFSGAELLAVSVIPNPFNDFIEIKSNGLSNVQVQIHDVQGRLVQSSVVDNGMWINTSDWMKGIYMITLTDGNQNIRTERMIK